MEKQDFIIFDGSSVFSNCCLYTNPNKGRVYLIPVVHFGTEQYYRNLLEYIGNSLCIYEHFQITSSDETSKRIPNIFDKQFEYIKTSTDQFWDKYHKNVERYYKKSLTKRLKKLRKNVHRIVDNSDERIKKILDLSERSFFGIQNIFLTQLYWAEITNLTHQFVAIDYNNDINMRDNWIHADMNIGKKLEDHGIDPLELLEEVLINPVPEFLDIKRSEIQFLLILIYTSVHMFELHNIADRREYLALSIMKSVTENQEVIEQQTPFLIQDRNTIVEDAISNLFEEDQEIFVFYGALHQIGIENFLLKQDFVFESQNLFEVFSINYTK
jgi:hypothetical protein